MWRRLSLWKEGPPETVNDSPGDGEEGEVKNNAGWWWLAWCFSCCMPQYVTDYVRDQHYNLGIPLPRTLSRPWFLWSPTEEARGRRNVGRRLFLFNPDRPWAQQLFINPAKLQVSSLLGIPRLRDKCPVLFFSSTKQARMCEAVGVWQAGKRKKEGQKKKRTRSVLQHWSCSGPTIS